jgi:hypothetical protein
VTPNWTGYLRFRPIFAKVVEPDDLRELDGKVITGRVQTWVSQNGAIVTELCRGDELYINVLIVGGDGGEIVNILRPQAERWAKTQGCTHVISTGRAKGWARVLAPHGYRPSGDGLRKELT